MRTFACQRCHQLVFFDNTRCLHCDAQLGFRWSDRELVALEPAIDGQLAVLAGDPGRYARCANHELARCNGLVPGGQAGGRCHSCALTRTRPHDDDEVGLAQFPVAEAAKRRLLFELGELGLPTPSLEAGHEPGLAFELLSSAFEPVTTGHADGVITLDLAETDDAHRERLRTDMGEPYRTLLGHFRHEVGHFYFTVLCPDDDRRARARALFGDDREDYGEALDRHYKEGAPDGWEEEHVSAYATMHPMEDWAETFAHYLHVQDTLQTAAAYRVAVRGPQPPGDDGPSGDLSFVPEDAGRGSMAERLAGWLHLSYALNAVNRSMGQDDLYPFVIPPPVVEKLSLLDLLVAEVTPPQPLG